jgi:ribonuclease HI
VGVLLLAPQRDQFKYMVRLDIKASNNVTEYEALLFGLSTALSLGVRQLLVKGDSQLIIKLREIAIAMIHSWPPICSMHGNYKRTLRS